ncbi:MAG: AAA-like domain-containing protein [Cyanobacteria bacterium J06648_16]
MGVGFPDGALPAESPFYIERPPVEATVYTALQQPGSLVRIRAASKMGKSSLLVKTLQQLEQLGYRTALVDFRTIDQAAYTNLPRFLKWLCATVAYQLRLPLRLADYWDEPMGAKLSCTAYLEQYLLPAGAEPLVLAFNEVNRIFAHRDIAEDVLSLLRFWYEEAQRSENFAQLRQIVIHSTDNYVPLSIHRSPFNVGLPIQLSPFTLAQISDLAQRYGLSLNLADVAQLLDRLGGHPYLTAIAFYHLSQLPQSAPSLAALLAAAPTQRGIYNHYLSSRLDIIQQQPQLQAALNQLLSTEQPQALVPEVTHQLASLGVITVTEAGSQLACKLYRQYFAQNRPASAPPVLHQLEQENQRLKQLINVDSLTRIANRRYFDYCLRIEWQRMLNNQSPLSLLLLDIDCFKQYNDTYGHGAGDRCLQQVARTLCHSIQRATDLVARYGGEEFAVILPVTDHRGAEQVGQLIRRNILALGLRHETSTIPEKVVSVSIGVATALPYAPPSLEALIELADKRMYAAKQQGRNRVTLSQRRLSATGSTGAAH